MTAKRTGTRLLFQPRGFLGLPSWLTRAAYVPRPRQLGFRFLERSEALARRFKLGILLGTAIVVLTPFAATSSGRHVAGWLSTRPRWGVLRLMGLPLDREEIDADFKRRRLHDIEQARGKLRSTYAEYGAPMQRLLGYAGLDPDHALLRWGNFDRTIYLPSTVFEADDTGRSYRFRPHTRAVWVRNLRLKGGILAYFSMPMTPRLSEIIEGTGALVVQTSVQTTNSWGLRGPEPDTEAPLRGIVLGDSYMQGLFVRDDQTPVECLKRELSARLRVRTEVLNTGHLGYSPEQEFFTLKEYAARFHPHFVVLSLFANDFGDLFEVLDGKGDWDEGKHWIGQITQYCRARGLICLVVPAPWVNQLEGPRKAGFYPGKISNILETLGMDYLDPIEDFVTELLRQTRNRRREGLPGKPDPLFNGHLGDGHFSPLGCEVWARAVAARVVRLIEYRRSRSAPNP